MDRRGSCTLTGEAVTYAPLNIAAKKSTDNGTEELKFTQNDTVPTNTGPKIGKRHMQMLFQLLLLVVNQCMRQHINLSIVAMTDPNLNKNKDIPTFNWTNRNVIISSFFWGYIGPQVFAGWLMSKYGFKWFLIVTTGVCALVGIFTPWLAIQFGSVPVIIGRSLQGVCQAFMVPGIACFMSKWVPLSERGRAGATIFSGGSLATVISMTISGMLASSDYGWPMNYYFFGAAQLLWCLLYSFIGSNTPTKHKSITDAEKSFILESTVDQSSKFIPKTPWGKIFTSVPFLVCAYTHTCNIFLMWILLSQIPTYMSKIMKFDVKSNGLLTSLIYLSQWLFSILMSIVSDYLTNKNYLSVSRARKLFAAFGMLFPCICLVLLAQCTAENSTKGVVLLIAGVGGFGANWCSTFLNHLDLAPNYAGVLQGFVNGISHILALLAPIIVQFMVVDEANPEQWKNVFYMSSGVALSGALLFVIFGSGEEQSWNAVERNEDEEMKMKK